MTNVKFALLAKRAFSGITEGVDSNDFSLTLHGMVNTSYLVHK